MGELLKNNGIIGFMSHFFSRFIFPKGMYVYRKI